MTDSTPVRRFILDGYGGVPRTEVVLASDFDRLQAENVRLEGEVAAETERDSLRAQLAARDERIKRLEDVLDAIQDKLGEYIERLLQGRTLPNRWVGEINEIVTTGRAADPISRCQHERSKVGCTLRPAYPENERMKHYCNICQGTFYFAMTVADVGTPALAKGEANE